jgi:pimeloyl-ACP methyl ester carboxylesterase
MRTPVRIIWGEHDAWLDPSIAERLQEIFPNSDLELISEAGHFSMEDRPDEVAQTLLDFFSQDRARA